VPRGYSPPEPKTTAITPQEQVKFDLERQKQMRDYAMDLMKLTKESIDSESMSTKSPLYTPDQAWAEAEKRFSQNGQGAAKPTQEGSTQFDGVADQDAEERSQQQHVEPAPGEGLPFMPKLTPGGSVITSRVPQTGSLPSVATKEDLDNLPAGTEFLGPDGKRRRKK
jgi:hypothetical protein